MRPARRRALSVVATGRRRSPISGIQGTSGTTTTPVGTNSPNFTTPALTVATNYWVRVTNTFGPRRTRTTAAITIGVGPAITTQPAASQTIASGATAALSVVATGTAPLTYQWFQGTSGTTTTPVGTNSPNFTTPALTVATNYWVRVTNTFGHGELDTAAIAIGVGPAITTQPAASQTIASGATAALSVVATGTAPLTYQWYQGTSGTTTDTGRHQQRELHDTGADSRRPTTGCASPTPSGRSELDTAAITIGVGPAITTQPAASQTIASGATAALSVVATGTAPLTYQWFQGTSGDDDDARGDQQRELHDAGADHGDQLLGAQVTNTFGTANSKTAAITIGVGPAITTQPAASQTIASGATAALSVVATGTAPLTYQWFQGHERHDDDAGRNQQRELHDAGTDHGNQLLGAGQQHLRDAELEYGGDHDRRK